MSNWITRPKAVANPKIRLFCFPYAGSSAVVTYKFLVDSLPPEIEVCPVEFPGRGSRMAEQLISNVDEVIDGIEESIKDYLDVPFAFLGHSMGALISYELALRLKKNKYSEPYKLYLSAHQAPHIPREGKVMHSLNSNEFLNELREMKGLAKEIMEHEELLNLMLPIIRNDYKLCETYKHMNGVKLNLPFHVFGGTWDKDIDKSSLEDWGSLTEADTKVELIQGDHFFILKEKEKFLSRFYSLLQDDLRKI